MGFLSIQDPVIIGLTGGKRDVICIVVHGKLMIIRIGFTAWLVRITIVPFVVNGVNVLRMIGKTSKMVGIPSKMAEIENQKKIYP